MVIYLLNFLTIPFYSFVIKNKKKCMILILFQMWLIMVLRSSMLGYDVIAYSQYYEVWSRYSFKEMILSTRFIKNQNIVWGLESGYVWLCWICAKLGFSFHSFLIVHSTICIIGVGVFLIKYCEDPIFALLIMIAFGVWGSFFYILRQSLAFVILLWACDSIIEKKPIKFTILYCTAVMFHRAAIVFIPLYFLSKIKITKKIIIIFTVVSIIWLFIFSRFYKYIYLFLKVFGKENMYALGKMKANNMLVCFLLIFFVVLIFSKKLELLQNQPNNILFWCFMFTILVEIISLYIPDFARIAICELFPFGAVLIANVFNQQNNENKKIIKATSYIILILFYVYILKNASYVPYKPMWG